MYRVDRKENYSNFQQTKPVTEEFRVGDDVSILHLIEKEDEDKEREFLKEKECFQERGF